MASLHKPNAATGDVCATFGTHGVVPTAPPANNDPVSLLYENAVLRSKMHMTQTERVIADVVSDQVKDFLASALSTLGSLNRAIRNHSNHPSDACNPAETRAVEHDHLVQIAASTTNNDATIKSDNACNSKGATLDSGTRLADATPSDDAQHINEDVLLAKATLDKMAPIADSSPAMQSSVSNALLHMIQAKSESDQALESLQTGTLAQLNRTVELLEHRNRQLQSRVVDLEVQLGHDSPSALTAEIQLLRREKELLYQRLRSQQECDTRTIHEWMGEMAQRVAATSRIPDYVASTEQLRQSMHDMRVNYAAEKVKLEELYEREKVYAEVQSAQDADVRHMLECQLGEARRQLGESVERERKLMTVKDELQQQLTAAQSQLAQQGRKRQNALQENKDSAHHSLHLLCDTVASFSITEGNRKRQSHPSNGAAEETNGDDTCMNCAENNHSGTGEDITIEGKDNHDDHGVELNSSSVLHSKRARTELALPHVRTDNTDAYCSSIVNAGKGEAVAPSQLTDSHASAQGSCSSNHSSSKPEPFVGAHVKELVLSGVTDANSVRGRLIQFYYSGRQVIAQLQKRIRALEAAEQRGRARRRRLARLEHDRECTGTQLIALATEVTRLNKQNEEQRAQYAGLQVERDMLQQCMANAVGREMSEAELQEACRTIRGAAARSAAASATVVVDRVALQQAMNQAQQLKSEVAQLQQHKDQLMRYIQMRESRIQALVEKEALLLLDTKQADEAAPSHASVCKADDTLEKYHVVSHTPLPSVLDHLHRCVQDICAIAEQSCQTGAGQSTAGSLETNVSSAALTATSDVESMMCPSSSARNSIEAVHARNTQSLAAHVDTCYSDATTGAGAAATLVSAPTIGDSLSHISPRHQSFLHLQVQLTQCSERMHAAEQVSRTAQMERAALQSEYEQLADLHNTALRERDAALERVHASNDTLTRDLTLLSAQHNRLRDEYKVLIQFAQQLLDAVSCCHRVLQMEHAHNEALKVMVAKEREDMMTLLRRESGRWQTSCTYRNDTNDKSHHCASTKNSNEGCDGDTDNHHHHNTMRSDDTNSDNNKGGDDISNSECADVLHVSHDVTAVTHALQRMSSLLSDMMHRAEQRGECESNAYLIQLADAVSGQEKHIQAIHRSFVNATRAQTHALAQRIVAAQHTWQSTWQVRYRDLEEQYSQLAAQQHSLSTMYAHMEQQIPAYTVSETSSFPSQSGVNDAQVCASASHDMPSVHSSDTVGVVSGMSVERVLKAIQNFIIAAKAQQQQQHPQPQHEQHQQSVQVQTDSTSPTISSAVAAMDANDDSVSKHDRSDRVDDNNNGDDSSDSSNAPSSVVIRTSPQLQQKQQPDMTSLNAQLPPTTAASAAETSDANSIYTHGEPVDDAAFNPLQDEELSEENAEHA